MKMFIPEPYNHLKRGPQVILPKDIGIIIAYSNIGKESICVDAGTGSGWLAIGLARVCKHVTSYDIREDFINIAEKNKAKEKLENLDIIKRDVTRKIPDKNVDLFTLDLPNAQKAVKTAYTALKTGGYICGYNPNIEQVKAFVKMLNKYKFENIVVFETILRDMLVREKEGTRPSTKGVWHTAYLTFGKKAQENQGSVKR
ncbi:MAG: methyltransferase domain-containing protein [Candidatus Micrarchaeia archaeon]